MSIVDIAYIELGKQILLDGSRRMDRTGTGTISIFGTRLDLDISSEFPLLSTKKLGIKSIIHELLWFLAGNTNIKYLVDNNVHIWDAWADKDGECGPIYGNQWRAWPTSDGKTIDQIAALITSLKNNPYSRRHIVSAWNVALVDKMALPPCHALFQFFVRQSTLAERIKYAKLQAEFYGTEEYGRALAHDPAAIAIINTALDRRGVPDKSLSCQLYQRSH